MRNALAVVATLVALASLGCDEQAAGPAVRAGVVLEIDGIVVHEAELTDLVRYVQSSGDRLGRNFATQIVLDRHVLPLRCAQRAFAPARAELRAKAEAMHRSVMASGGADPQLRSKGAILGGEASPGLLSRAGMELAQAAWCFAPDSFGLVSPVLEVPRGFCLLSVADHRPGIERTGDLVDAYQVPFYTHDQRAFGAWWDEHKGTLAGKLTYVHPDYRDALPTWIQR